jgi:hypothetical protein
MRVRLSSIAALAILLAGCAQVHVVDPGAPSTGLDSMNDALIGRNASIELAEGERISGRDVHVGALSTTWLRPEGDVTPVSVPTSSVRSITVMERIRPAILGGVVGLVTGMVAGGALGLSALADSGLEVLGVIAYGAMGATGGLVAGASLGAVVGIKRVYVIGAGSDSPAGDRPRD